MSRSPFLHPYKEGISLSALPSELGGVLNESSEQVQRRVPPFPDKAKAVVSLLGCCLREEFHDCKF